MRRIAFINEKGGTGKTTLAVNVAAYLASRHGRRVLLVDLDTQGHAGKSLGLDVRELRPNAFHLLSDPAVPLDAVIRPTGTERLWVIPSYKEMSEFPSAVAGEPRRTFRLADRLAGLDGRFDVLVFDSPPSMGLTTFNILCAATEVVVPVALTYLSLDGCAEVVKTVEGVCREHDRPGLRVTRVVPTLYRKTALADAILAKLHEHFAGAVSPVPLSFSVKIDEAQSHGQTIWEYAPRCKGAELLAQISEDLWSAGAGAKPRAAAG